MVIHQSIADDMGHIIPTRAFDSEIPIVAAIFNGGSYAVDSQGKLLGKLPAEAPDWKIFQVQPFKIRTHRKYGGLWIPKQGHRNLRNVGAYEFVGQSVRLSIPGDLTDRATVIRTNLTMQY